MHNYQRSILVFISLFWAGLFLNIGAYPHNIVNVSTAQEIKAKLPKGWPTDGIVIFPEAGRDPWVKAITTAKKSINIAAYKLSDPVIIDALCTIASAKKVSVNLLIEANAFQHEKSENIISPVEKLSAAGVNIFHISEWFNQAHYKLILVDNTWGMLSTGNLDKESFDGIKEISEAPCRDFAITVTKKSIVQELKRIFDADIKDKRIHCANTQIVLGPDDQRSVFLKLINTAKKSIRIYQQDFQDVGIAKALAGAAKDGVKVEVLMMPYPFSKTQDNNIPNQNLIRSKGGTVHLHKHHYVHAKLILVDAEEPENAIMYVGSCNFYTASLDQTRELGILTKDKAQIAKVMNVFNLDLKV